MNARTGARPRQALHSTSGTSRANASSSGSATSPIRSSATSSRSATGSAATSTRCALPTRMTIQRMPLRSSTSPDTEENGSAGVWLVLSSRPSVR
ncbi:hypothetical protein N8I74_02605 [Chitiniphilus purpureus]|uniref:Uncharacterized protein n=1 Tax=Chitiniphilus purpureus TaxID=2981137 RepID=A0ABY6DNH6_9NEIS|nr:hypothetical protein [Chitiniphilus sp. CD1]UXY15927.1 hypothetical protein N8I74_02605 [Chitiniphilus sp. CD1]